MYLRCTEKYRNVRADIAKKKWRIERSTSKDRNTYKRMEGRHDLQPETWGEEKSKWENKEQKKEI